MKTSNRNKGFILLHTLVLILIGATLVLLAMEIGLGGAFDSHTAWNQLRLDAAAESGVHRALFDLLGKRKPNVDGEPTILQIEVDGFAVELQTQYSDGLVSLRSGDTRHIQRILSDALGSTSTTASASLSRALPLSSYTDLIALDGIGAEGFARLLPYVTLFSDNTEPVAEHAPSRLRDLLGQRKSTAIDVMQQEHRSPAGSTYRIQSRAKGNGHRSRTLMAEVLLTGRADQPIWVLEWMWISNAELDE